jgi:hypothetical protein
MMDAALGVGFLVADADLDFVLTHFAGFMLEFGESGVGLRRRAGLFAIDGPGEADIK